MSQLFAWGGQSIGVSASSSVLPMNTQGILEDDKTMSKSFKNYIYIVILLKSLRYRNVNKEKTSIF